MLYIIQKSAWFKWTRITFTVPKWSKAFSNADFTLVHAALENAGSTLDCKPAFGENEPCPKIEVDLRTTHHVDPMQLFSRRIGKHKISHQM